MELVDADARHSYSYTLHDLGEEISIIVVSATPSDLIGMKHVIMLEVEILCRTMVRTEYRMVCQYNFIMLKPLYLQFVFESFLLHG